MLNEAIPKNYQKLLAFFQSVFLLEVKQNAHVLVRLTTEGN